MVNSARHVLKDNEVQFAGSLQLGTDQAAVRRKGPQPDAKAVCVRIAEAHPEFAVVEVACSCGRSTYVRCEYAANNGPPVPPEPVQG